MRAPHSRGKSRHGLLATAVVVLLGSFIPVLAVVNRPWAALLPRAIHAGMRRWSARASGPAQAEEITQAAFAATYIA